MTLVSRVGGLKPLLYMAVYIFTNISESTLYVEVCVSQYQKTIFLNFFCAFEIVVDSTFFFIMLVAV